MLVGLRLRPAAAAAVFGRPVSEFTDRVVPLDAAFGVAGDRVAEKVFGATTPGQRVAALQQLLTEHLAHTEPFVDTAVFRAIGMLQLAAALAGVRPGRRGRSQRERQLRRRFEAAVGFGPKRLGRILRLQRLLELIHARDDRVRWSELAIEASYADQPHMINECRALAGASPAALPGGMSVSSNTAAGDTS